MRLRAGHLLRLGLTCLVLELVIAERSRAMPPSMASVEQLQRVVEMIGRNIVSTPDYEHGVTLSLDGGTLYFAKRTGNSYTYYSVICISRRARAGWATPTVAPFSGQYIDADPVIAPDGRRLFFSSNRPLDDTRRVDMNLWFVEWTDGRWSEPRPVPGSVNSTADERSPSLASDGTLYFTSTRAGSRGGIDIYRAALRDDRYDDVVALDTVINSTAFEVSVFVDPNERYLITSIGGRTDEALAPGVPYVRGDLYVSERVDERWSALRRVSSPINSEGVETTPFVSRDGRYLYFTSDRGFATLPPPPPRRLSLNELTSGLQSVENGLGNLYRVDIEAVELRR